MPDDPVFMRSGVRFESMPELSDEMLARSRKNQTLVLQRLASVGQAPIAQGLGVSEATISRWKSEQSEQTAKMLALLGLKVVPATMQCYEPKQIGAILALAKARLAQIETPSELEWEGDS